MPLDSSAILRAYGMQSPVYDLLFKPFYGPGQARALRAMAPTSGQRVLEVGAGTGLSLRHYPPGVRLTGIDLSESMLTQARRRAQDLGLDANFRIMDAQAMDFPNGHFDQVVAMHLVSVVPEPSRLIGEMRRVCKPGGRLTLVNHLCSDGPPTRLLRKALTPLQGWLGFKPLYSRREFQAIGGGLDWRALDGQCYGFVVLQAVNP